MGIIRKTPNKQTKNKEQINGGKDAEGQGTLMYCWCNVN
jgi:hypothetical protein